MKLNTRAQSAQSPHNNSPVVLVHGLFGSLDNLGVLARDLVTDHNILQVDMRNHGVSPRHPEITLVAIDQDLLDTVGANNIDNATQICHAIDRQDPTSLTRIAT